METRSVCTKHHQQFLVNGSGDLLNQKANDLHQGLIDALKLANEQVLTKKTDWGIDLYIGQDNRFGTCHGSMWFDYPNVPTRHYLRVMQLWMLFFKTASKIDVLQFGLGAGESTRFCVNSANVNSCSVVEINNDVIEHVKRYMYLPYTTVVYHDDASKFKSKFKYDVVQVDLYNSHENRPAVSSWKFYRTAWRLLKAAGGVLVVNLCGTHKSVYKALALMESSTGQPVYSIRIPEKGRWHVIAFVFRGECQTIRSQSFRKHAAALDRKFKLMLTINNEDDFSFHRFANRMIRACWHVI